MAGEEAINPQQALALTVAHGLRYNLKRGKREDYEWLFTPEFETWAVIWSEAAQLREEVDVSALRDKIIETMWRPKEEHQ